MSEAGKLRNEAAGAGATAGSDEAALQAETGAYPVLAVVHGSGPTAVWQVDTDPSAKTGQFVGAWLVGVGETEIARDAEARNKESWAGAKLAQSALPLLVAGRPILATDTGREALKGMPEEDAAAAEAALVDMPATVAHIRDLVAKYRAAFEAENARRAGEKVEQGKQRSLSKLTALSYPKVPDLEAATTVEPAGDFAGHDIAREALSVAEGARRIIDAWNEIDGLRRTKANDYLSEFGGRELQPIPLVIGITEGN